MSGSNGKKLFIGLFVFCAWIYAFFSYIFVDTNLVLTSIPAYWNLQQWLWQVLLPKNDLIVNIFILLIILFFIAYFGVLLTTKKIIFSKKELIASLILIFVPFFIAHNALSHDIFNYIFNAKIVVDYQGNPHATSAGSYTGELWLRFMHNTHTLSPYGYAWTAITLIPFLLGFGKFLLIYVNFKLFALFSLIVSVIYIDKILKQTESKHRQVKLLLFALNPLILIEYIGNAHNDIFMMQFALMSYFYLILFTEVKKKKSAVCFLIISISLLLISIGMKISTVVLASLFALVIFLKFHPIKNFDLKIITKEYFPILASVLLFIPLFFERSEQFYPWYLVWSLAWLPFIKNKYLAFALISFSFSSLIRYIPWIEAGFNYGDEVEQMQRNITWIGGLLVFIFLYFSDRLFKKRLLDES